MGKAANQPGRGSDQTCRPVVRLRPMAAGDAKEVLAIYQEGIETGHATFQEAAPAWSDWDRTHLAACRLVAETDRGLAGWAALSPVSARPVYRGVAELSLYVAAASRGQGTGGALLSALVEAADRDGIWTLQTGIFPENRASLALHRSLGFRIVGTRERLGLMTYGPCADRWRDVIMIERRSLMAGADG